MFCNRLDQRDIPTGSRNTRSVPLVALLSTLSVAAVMTCGYAIAEHAMCAGPPADIEPMRSLFVTDVEVLQQTMSLQELLGALAEDIGNPTFGPHRLWQQLWDTQNPAPGLGLGFHCDDQRDANGVPTLNSFPIQCPRNEGREVSTNPFNPTQPSYYKLISLVNRMDLAPANGANCGVFRAIFARSGGSRNHVIFEAVLPNPAPSCGLEGCRVVAEFWARLSEVDSPAERAANLRAFYLRGFPARGVAPVVDAAHFTFGSGQIRTNSFMRGPEPSRWQLREFKLVKVCPAGRDCFPLFTPITVQQNPYGGLFDETSSHPRTAAFQQHYLGQVANLAIDDILGFFAAVPDAFNAGQSTSSQSEENDYPVHFANSPQFQSAVSARLAQLGSSLSAEHLVRRSMALSCAGCHERSGHAPANDLGQGITWPPSLGFVHVSELLTTTIDGRQHYAISPALIELFLPHRKQVLDAYLDGLGCTACPAAAGEAVRPADVFTIHIDAEGRPSVALDPELLRALDSRRRSGIVDQTLGGTRAVH